MRAWTSGIGLWLWILDFLGLERSLLFAWTRAVRVVAVMLDLWDCAGCNLENELAACWWCLCDELGGGFINWEERWCPLP